MRKACSVVVMTAVGLLGYAGAMGAADDHDSAIAARMRALTEVPPNSSEARAEFKGRSIRTARQLPTPSRGAV
jgi:hypothetical protein